MHASFLIDSPPDLFCSRLTYFFIFPLKTISILINPAVNHAPGGFIDHFKMDNMESLSQVTNTRSN